MIKRLHHVGLSVRNMDVSIDFYTRVLGMEILHKAEFGSAEMDAITALEGAKGKGTMLGFEGGCIELFEFTHPISQPANLHRPVCDHGITHFCLRVESIDIAYTRLQEAGVLLHCEPKPFGDMKALYARDPDGNVFELLE